MPVTSGWIKVTKVKDDGGKANRYAKGKSANSKCNSKSKSRAKTTRVRADDDAIGTAIDRIDDTDDDDDDDVLSKIGREEELMYRHTSSRCSLCRQTFTNSDATLRCLAVADCDAEFHIVCLSERFLADEVKAGFAETDSQIVPVSGRCPRCKTELLWGDLIRFKRGCYKKELEDGRGAGGSDGDHWADLLTQR